MNKLEQLQNFVAGKKVNVQSEGRRSYGVEIDTIDADRNLHIEFVGLGYISRKKHDNLDVEFAENKAIIMNGEENIIIETI